MVALVAAMPGRLGWIDWPAIGIASNLISVGVALVESVVVVVGVPMLLMAWSAALLVTFLTDSPDVASQQQAPHGGAPAAGGPASPALLTWEGA
jgi:hypothetical protein